jgi:F420-non-reducing hydrogenase iron-sulfur subunit
MKKKLIAFCCENSAAVAAEGLSDPGPAAEVEFVTLPCLGKIEVGLLLKCLERGHPGVLVLGCPLENCRYLTGSARAAGRVKAARRALTEAGLPEDLVRMEYLSSLDTWKLEAAVEGMPAAPAASRSGS